KGDDSKMKNEQNTTQPTTGATHPANDKIEMLPVSKLEDFKSHPFNVTENEDFNKLMESIKENGVLMPAIARPKGDSYELISGHRRKAVCEKLGIDTMPVIVREMTDEQSIIYMVDSNVQRENILPSEKAFAYKMKMDALKRQGQRSDLTSTPVVSKLRTDETVGLESGESREQVRRYIRLTELNPQLLKLVDEGKIGLRPAVELSFLTKPHQKLLLSVMESEQSTPSLAQAQKLKLYSLEGLLDENKVTSLMQQQKPNQHESIKISCGKIRELLNKDMTVNEIENFIFSAITDYQKKLQRQRNDRAR
ncbi:MAG: ParB/RepB/Spo0J family partition protein, partial [Oscillospiraceae bacterium]|nr:ParB/RepB/Spo0J family partition protein [Oscillospiraceae bacterium]